MVDTIKMDGRVQLKLKTGTDEQGKDLFATRTYPRVKATTTDEGAYYGAIAIGSLYKGQVAGIFRIQTSELVEY